MKRTLLPIPDPSFVQKGMMVLPVKSYDFTGKTIIPFCTNEGSGMGSSVRFIKKLCPGATVEDGTPIHGAEAAYADSEAREIAELAK